MKIQEYREILENSSDEEKLNLLRNTEQMKELKDYEIIKIMNTLSNSAKVQILMEPKLIQTYEIENFQIEDLVKNLDDENKLMLMSNSQLIQKGLSLEEYQINRIIASFESETIKMQMIENYHVSKFGIKEIISTFSDESKTKIITDNPYELNRYDLISVISTIHIDHFSDFFNTHKEFFKDKDIKLYSITSGFNKDKQLQLLQHLEELDVNMDEKRKVLATMHKQTKEEIDMSKVPKEYVSALNLEMYDSLKDFNAYGHIKVDFSKDLEVYRGLDEIIYMNPLQISEQDKDKILELCEICPKMSIKDNLMIGESTVEEYKNGEKWIKSILQEMKPDWSEIQKIAFIDHAIGKKISYTPDFDTEVCNEAQTRALWKIIHTGYGVCNGIAQVEKYMLEQIGIESELVSSRKHSFLKLKNIEIPSKSGEIKKGNTILDPTWNLSAQRFSCRPNNFCRSYQEIRKHDRRNDGADSECHKNDEKLLDATLDVEDEVLRNVFRSIGLADKDGNFPIKAFIDKTNQIDNLELSQEEKIQRQFALLAEYCPEFAICPNSTSSILQGVILNKPNFNFKRCVVNRVYAKDDQEKRPTLYVYIDSEEMGKKFYFADKEQGKFLDVPQKEFESKFECYENDMRRNKGYRDWEDKGKIEKVEDLTRSSGKIESKEGEER